MWWNREENNAQNRLDVADAPQLSLKVGMQKEELESAYARLRVGRQGGTRYKRERREGIRDGRGEMQGNDGGQNKSNVARRA